MFHRLLCVNDEMKERLWVRKHSHISQIITFDHIYIHLRETVAVSLYSDKHLLLL